MSRVYIAESSIHGTGLFSSAHFSPGEIVMRIDDSRVLTGADPLDPAKSEFEHHCDYLAGGKVILMQPPERFINHRCDPNTFVRTITGDRYVVAMREIRPGDEITGVPTLRSRPGQRGPGTVGDGGMPGMRD